MIRARTDLSASNSSSVESERDETVLVTMLPNVRVTHLAACLEAEVRLFETDRHLRSHGLIEFWPHAMVVDPLVCGSIVELERALRAMLVSCPIVVYTTVTPEAMRRTVGVPALAGATLILAGVDDTPRVWRATIGALRESALRRRALAAIDSRAGPLPPDVARALATLLAKPEELSVIALARAANMCSRTLERRLDEAGAPPPLWLVRTARAVLARELLRVSGLTVEDVARRVGYTKVESLRALLRWCFQSSPSALRDARESADVAACGAHRGTLGARLRDRAGRRVRTIVVNACGRVAEPGC